MAEPSAIDDLLERSRAGLDRVAAADLAAEQASGALTVDIRPESFRTSEGELPGAIVIERIHLEWRLDPTSPHRIPEATPDRRVIVVCNEGYASSLAAATLRELGVHRATDLVGGFRGWLAHTASSSALDRPGTPLIHPPVSRGATSPQR